MLYYFIPVVLILFVILLAIVRCKMDNGIRIFMYHHIVSPETPDQTEFFVHKETFAKQLDMINEKGFNALTLSEFENACEHNKKLPKRSVLITLDDGWRDNYDYAFPVIKEKKIPVTIFLSTGSIGNNPDFLSWEQIDEMKKTGLVQFASHGVNHKRLRKLTDEEVLSELTGSKKELEEIFKEPVKSFCYPYGSFDGRVRKLVFKAGYSLDYGTRKGINSWPWKRKRPLLRAHILNNESLKDFYHQLCTGYKNSIFAWLFPRF